VYSSTRNNYNFIRRRIAVLCCFHNNFTPLRLASHCEDAFGDAIILFPLEQQKFIISSSPLHSNAMTIPAYIYIPMCPTSADVGYPSDDEASCGPPSCSCSIPIESAADESERWKATDAAASHRSRDESRKAPTRQSHSMSWPKLPERRGSFRIEDVTTMPPKLPSRKDSSTSLSLGNDSDNLSYPPMSSNVALTADIGPIRVSSPMPRTRDIRCDSSRSNSTPNDKEHLHVASPLKPSSVSFARLMPQKEVR
jgi:hypothetical protein